MLNQVDKNLLIERYARNRESKLIEQYISEGPSQIQDELGLDDQEWQVIFDYLVFEHNLLYKSVTQSKDFFLDLYIKHGMAHIRDILDVNDDKYNAMLEVVFDFLAIASEGLYYHLLEHRERYIMAFRVRGGDFIRKILGIWKEKYEEHWAKVLEFLLKTVCEDIFNERNFEHGLRGFASLMNIQRQHRPVAKSEIVSKGLL